MKNKILVLLAFALLTAGTAIAETNIIGGTSAAIGTNGTFTPSNKVGVKVTSTAASYAATSTHLNATYEYGTVGGTGVTGDPSKILKKSHSTSANETTAGYGIPTSPTSATALAAGYTD